MIDLTVYRQPGDRGPRHKHFPDINISVTAARYGISKSQLSRLLNGENRPSMRTLQVLADILHKSLAETIAVFDGLPVARRRKKPKVKAKSRRKDR